MTSSTFAGNEGTGVQVRGGQAKITGCAVLGPQSRDGQAGGDGMLFQDAGVTIESSAVSGSPEVGVLLFSSTVSISHTVISDGKLTAFGEHGDGVIATEDSLLELTDTDVQTSKGAGLVCAGVSARIRGGVFIGNEIALSVQGGTTLQTAANPAPVAVDHVLIVGDDTIFKDNAAKLSSGALRVPQPPVR